VRKETYAIYLSVIVALTIISSFLVIQNKLKPKYILIMPEREVENESCPCKDFEKGSSKCEIQFMKESENPALNLELRPGVEQVFDGFGICIPATTIKINSYGFRDYEYTVVKPSNTFRIVALGDSYTFGHGVELNETYSKVLERLLNKRNDGWRYEVLNFGVPGYNAAEKVEILASKATKFEPDLVIFQYLNDDIVNWTEFRQIEERKMQEYAQKTGQNVSELTNIEKREIHENTYRDYINMLEDKRFDETWKIVEISFERLAFTIQNKTVLLLVDADEPQLSKLDNISRTYSWHILHVKDFLGNYPKEERLIIHPKDIHPNAFAHELIAENIYKEFIQNNLLPTS
jgi:lysophospholipase L1-like esterase